MTAFEPSDVIDSRMMNKRVTIFIMHADNNADFIFMKAWFKKWESKIHIENYVSGGFEHCWDVEAPENAIDEIPEDWLCMSKWANPDVFNKH